MRIATIASLRLNFVLNFASLPLSPTDPTEVLQGEVPSFRIGSIEPDTDPKALPFDRGGQTRGPSLSDRPGWTGLAPPFEPEGNPGQTRVDRGERKEGRDFAPFFGWEDCQERG